MVSAPSARAGSDEIQREENTDFEIISLDEAGREEIENRLNQYDVQYISYRLNGGAAVGIKRDGRLIAGAIGYMSAFHILYVGTVFVDEEYRRRGIGTMLMAEVEHRALALGADTIRLSREIISKSVFSSLWISSLPAPHCPFGVPASFDVQTAASADEAMRHQRSVGGSSPHVHPL